MTEILQKLAADTRGEVHSVLGAEGRQPQAALLGRSLSAPSLSEAAMPARVLPVRVAPLRGELFSSWFTRLAYANGKKVLGLASSLFGRNHGLFGGRDSDRGDRQRVIEGLSCATGLPAASIVDTTLASYKGLLWDEVSSGGSRRWILPAVDRRHLHVLPGMQVCPACLREDAIPFYRKSWRVAFHVLCADHGCVLMDRCAGCGLPLSVHRGRCRFVHAWRGS